MICFIVAGNLQKNPLNSWLFLLLKTAASLYGYESLFSSDNTIYAAAVYRRTFIPGYHVDTVKRRGPLYHKGEENEKEREREREREREETICMPNDSVTFSSIKGVKKRKKRSRKLVWGRKTFVLKVFSSFSMDFRIGRLYTKTFFSSKGSISRSDIFWPRPPVSYAPKEGCQKLSDLGKVMVIPEQMLEC